MAEERNLLVFVRSLDQLQETEMEIRRRGFEVIAVFQSTGVMCVRGDPGLIGDMEGIVFREEQIMSVN